MDDLSRFLEFLYGNVDGYVYVATKDTLAINQAWEQTFFLWPNDKERIYSYITTEQEERDVYVAPALFKAKNSLKKSVQGTNVLWVEFDGQQQIDFNGIPEPDCIVQTSVDTHLHCYWRIDYLEDINAIDSINRRLTHYLEADASGFDANQVLRPPNSKNWKHNGLPVTLKHLAEAPLSHEFAAFSVAPEIQQEVIKLNADMLLDPGKLLSSLDLHAKLKKRVKDEVVVHPHRSSFLMKVAHELAEEGCNHLQIVSLLDFVDDRIGKFAGRRDKLTRLSEIASIALLPYQEEDGPTLYSPLDVLNHKEHLTWIIPNWLHTAGFCILTGPPGAGKTSLGLQLLHALSSSQSFLERTTIKVERILFMSLEMGVLELQYFFRHHNLEFKSDSQWDQRVRILDQDMTLLEYETLIAEYEPQVILIDSLMELATEEVKETEARAITRWIRKMRRRYSCAFLVIHHNTKESSKKKFKEMILADVYGSYIFGKDVDTVLNLERDSSDDSLIALYSLKQRYEKKFMMELSQNPETLIFSKKEAGSDSQQPGPTGDSSISFGFSKKSDSD